MRPLDECMAPWRGAILGNPIFCPTESLIIATEKQRFFLSRVTFHKPEISIAQYQSSLGTMWFYDFLCEESLWNLTMVSRWYKDALFRIIPDSFSFDNAENFRDGVVWITEALEAWFLQEVSYAQAVINIVNILEDDAEQDISDDIKRFKKRILEQLQKVSNILEREGLSQRNVLQVTTWWDEKVVMLPKEYFHDEDGGKREKWDVRERLSGILWWAMWWWKVVPT